MAINKEVVEALLEKLQEYLGRVEVMDFSKEELTNNVDIQDMLTHRLHTAVEVCVDIGNHLAAGLKLPGRAAAKDVFGLLAGHGLISSEVAEAMQGAIGFRNIIVHEYDEVDFEMVYKDYQQDVADMKAFARDVLGYLESRG